MKLWDTSGNAPSCLLTRDPKLVRPLTAALLHCCSAPGVVVRKVGGGWGDQGAVFSLAFCGDAPYMLAMGGSKGKLVVSGGLFFGQRKEGQGYVLPRVG